ncbi:MAG TPA: HD-GYP domain-containing protein [Treponemataceae bacterium]|nr:HD-GYP domain-containing protein [Treponemataceae bacterium]
MLKKVYRNELSEGMRFSAPVFFDDGENMLVSKGTPIKERELKALDRWKIQYVLTAGNPLSPDQDLDVDDPSELDELEDLDEIEEPDSFAGGPSHSAATAVAQPAVRSMHETPEIDTLEYTSEQILKLPAVLENHGLYQEYSTLIEELDQVFTNIREQKEIKSRAIDKIVNDLITLIQKDRSGILGFILGGDVREMVSAKCAVNTAILSVIIAEQLSLPRHRLLQVATGALLHDVGMLRIPDSIINKDGKLDDNEQQIMRSHTFYGYKFIVNELLYADEVGKAAVQHHERWDGEGYPARLAGPNIDIGGRIVSVADAFEAMVSPKAWRDSMVGYKAMKNLLSDNARRFDPDIIKAMIQSMGIYPVGSIVLMNNSVIARVVDTNRDAPLRPKIRVLIDEFARPYTQNEGELIDLTGNHTLFIARAIDPSEYQKKR